MRKNTETIDSLFNSDYVKKNLNKKAIRSGGFSVVTRVFSHIIRTGNIIILARLISPEEFGIFAMAFSFIGFFIILNDIGLTNAVIQVENLNHSMINSLFWINILFCSFITFLVIIASPIVSMFYKESKVTLIIILLSFNFLFSGISIQHRGLLKRNLKFSKIAIIEVCSIIFSDLLSILLAFLGWGYWALVVRRLSWMAMMSLAAWVLCEWRPGLPKYDPEVKPLLAFGVNSLGSLFINNIPIYLDKALIGWRFGAEKLGFYHKGFNLAALPSNQLSQSLFHVSVSTLSKLKSEPEKFCRYYLNALETIAFIGLPLTFYLAVMSKDIILFLLGSKWLPAAQLFGIFAIGAGIQIIYSTCGWLHASQGRADRWLHWNIVASILIICAIIIGLFFGVKGVAITYTITLYIIFLPALKYAGKPMNLRLFSIFNTLWRYFFAAISSGFICWIIFNYLILKQSSFINILLSFFIFSFFYIIILIILFMSLKPIIQFISFLKKVLPTKKKVRD